MNGKQLKNSILQWAIQGKLVPQDPNDEPASVLLERIRAEKARLVTLVERLKERRCELCGKMGDLVMHHVRNINQLKADTRWNTMMIKRHRKTLAVCHDCDALIHKSYD